MFDTGVEVPDFDVRELCPCDTPPLLPTVWDVLAGRVEPGPDAIRALKTVDPRDLDAATRAGLVSAWEAQDSWLEAEKLTALHALSLPEPVVFVDDPTDRGFAVVPDRVRAEETRLALGCSPAWATQRTWLAHHLSTRLHKTRELLEAGRISAYLAGIAVAESQSLSDEECAVFEARVYPRGESQSPARFRRSARLVASVLHPQRLEDAHRVARKATDVTTWVDDAGMASLRMHAPAPQTFEVYDAINTEAWAQARAAKRDGQEHVPIGQRRVEVLLRLARTSASDREAQQLGLGINPGDPDPDDVTAILTEQISDGVDLEQVSEPSSAEVLNHLERLAAQAEAAAAAADASETPNGSKPANVNPWRLPRGAAQKISAGVIIDLDVLLGARDGPAVLEGYGPIPASMARELAADASWRRVLLEPATGSLLDYGRRHYRPPKKLRDHLLGLGQDCRGAYCNARPRQTDHGTDWADGGRTSTHNCNGMCIHTHFLKTAHNFTVTNNDDGSITWTTPAGNTYTKPPDDLRITDHGKE
jgi:Domain of unknown function (DUF222)